MKSAFSLVLWLTIAATTFSAVHSNGPPTIKHAKSRFGLIFFRASKDRRISLADICQEARKVLKDRFSDFPEEKDFDTLHIECKGSKASFYFYYGSEEVGGKYWSVKLSADLKVLYVDSGRVGGR